MFEGEYKYDYIDAPEVVSEYTSLNTIFGSERVTLEYLPQLTTDMSLIMYALTKTETPPDFLVAKTAGGISIRNDYAVNRDYDDVSEFHKIRRETIINLIVDTLNEKINNHNRYADIMGITYDFYLPEIADDTWINSIDDVSIMAFVQGIPTGYETYYNSYALGSSRIIRKDYIYGVTTGGIKFYHKSDCPTLSGQIDAEGYPTAGSTIDNLFLNNIDAATNGYYPCMECKP